MRKVLIFGKHGQLASELRSRTGETDSIRYVGQIEFSPADEAGLSALIEKFQPEVIVNCAAYTAVDKAETDQEACFLLNRDFVGTLARISSKANVHLIHFSTDYVFDGKGRRPYSETDEASPINTYGVSKLAGERAIMQFASSATIIRTSWVYSKYGANFVKSILRLANSEKPLRVISDQFGTPTSASELAEFVLNFVLKSSDRLKAAGVSVFHFSGEGETTWNEFAREVAKLWQTKQQHIAEIPSSEYPTPAKRPIYGVLSKEKVKREFGIEVVPWREGLKKCFDNWSEE